MQSAEKRHLDKRIVERSLRKGLLSKDDYLRHLEQLGDAAENASYVSYGDEELPQEEAQ